MLVVGGREPGGLAALGLQVSRELAQGASVPEVRPGPFTGEPTRETGLRMAFR